MTEKIKENPYLFVGKLGLHKASVAKGTLKEFKDSLQKPGKDGKPTKHVKLGKLSIEDVYKQCGGKLKS